MLPGELLGRLDLEGLTAEPTHFTGELCKKLTTDVIYRMPINGTEIRWLGTTNNLIATISYKESSDAC
jgi:hypothetical protein